MCMAAGTGATQSSASYIAIRRLYGCKGAVSHALTLHARTAAGSWRLIALCASCHSASSSCWNHGSVLTAEKSPSAESSAGEVWPEAMRPRSTCGSGSTQHSSAMHSCMGDADDRATRAAAL